jgi:hypothetical protein
MTERFKSQIGEAMWWVARPDFNPYTSFEAQVPGECALEKPLGLLAERGGLPTSKMRGKPVAVVGGVPVKGFADLLGEHPAGGDLLLDHKTVSQVVKFYPTYSGRKVYGISYRPGDSLQLDFYQGASGAERAGYQFFLKQPQYDGRLSENWHDERRWEGEGFPFGKQKNAEGEIRWVAVWRPCALDAKGAENTFPKARVRAAYQTRRASETITEGLYLLEEGVEPEIAFPPGDPDEIARKACPYCHFNPEVGEGGCANPREETEASREEWRSAWETREELVGEHFPDLRAEWKGQYGMVGGGLPKGPHYPIDL